MSKPDKTYLLSDFIEPTERDYAVASELAKYTDCTQSFEVYHIANIVAAHVAREVARYKKIIEYIAKQDKSDEWEQEGDTEFAYDHMITICRELAPKFAENALDEFVDGVLVDIRDILSGCAYEPSERGAGIAFHESALNECHDVLLKAFNDYMKGAKE